MTFSPELGQMATGSHFHRFEAPRRAGDEIAALAEAVCERYPDAFPAPREWQEYDYPSAAAAAAQEHFLHWGGGWFENDVFLLHAYTYDDNCNCGSISSTPLENGPPYYRWDTDPELVGALGEDKDILTRARQLLCACPDGWSDVDPLVPPLALAPNFLYKPEPGLAIDWYKHCHRGLSWSRDDCSMAELRQIVNACIGSLDKEPTATATRSDGWPSTAARKAQYATQRDAFLALPAEERERLLAR